MRRPGAWPLWMAALPVVGIVMAMDGLAHRLASWCARR